MVFHCIVNEVPFRWRHTDTKFVIYKSTLYTKNQCFTCILWKLILHYAVIDSFSLSFFRLWYSSSLFASRIYVNLFSPFITNGIRWHRKLTLETNGPKLWHAIEFSGVQFNHGFDECGAINTSHVTGSFIIQIEHIKAKFRHIASRSRQRGSLLDFMAPLRSRQTLKCVSYFTDAVIACHGRGHSVHFIILYRP